VAVAAAASAAAAAAAAQDDDAALQQELLDCACWRDVMDVVEDEAAGMSARNLVLALSKLARGRKAAAAADAETAADPAADRAALLASPGLSALLARLEDSLRTMTAFQAANALYSLALLGVRLDGPSAPRPQLGAAADAAVARLAPSYNERDVASTLYAAAVSRRPPSDAAAVPLLRRAQALVARGEMAPRGVAMALWSCATLMQQGERQQGQQQQQQKAEERQQQSEEEEKQEAADTAGTEGEAAEAAEAAAAAAAAPKRRGKQQQQQQQPSESSAFAAAVGPFAGVAAAFLSKPDAFAELAPQGVANACWAVARLQGSAPAQLLEQACELLAACCRAEEKGGVAAPPSAAAASAAATTTPSECRPQEVLNTLWACVRSRHHPRAALPAVVRYCARRAPQLAAADVSSLFHALGTFGHDAAGDEDGGGKASGGGGGGKSGKGSSASSTSTPTPPPLQALLRRAEELLPSMHPVEAASLYWGLGLARAAEGAVFERLTADVLPAMWRDGRLSQRALQRQVFTGYLCHRLAGGKGSLPREMLAELKQAWAEGLGGGAPPPSAAASAPRPRLSPLARDLHRRLRSLRVAHDAGARTPDGLAAVDAALRAGGGALVALQLGAEGDYASNLSPRKLLGPALFRRDLLERNGFARVRVVPANEYAAVPMHARPAYVAELLRGLGVGVRRDVLEAAAAESAEATAGGKAKRGGAAAAAPAAKADDNEEKEAEDDGRISMSWSGKTAAAAAVAEASAATVAEDEEEDDDSNGPPADASKPRSARRAATALGAPGARRGGANAARVTDAVATTAEINMIVDALVGTKPGGGGGRGGGGGGGGAGGGKRRR
jgi:hypothetical protein